MAHYYVLRYQGELHIVKRDSLKERSVRGIWSSCGNEINSVKMPSQPFIQGNPGGFQFLHRFSKVDTCCSTRHLIRRTKELFPEEFI